MNISGKAIDERHLKMLEIILMDERIFKSLHVDGELAKKIQLRSDGSIEIGRYKYGWVNKLFNSYYVISFFEVVQKISSIITGASSNNCDMDGLVGLIHESIDKVLRKDEKEKMIELLMFYCCLISEDSPLKLSYNVSKDNPSLNQNQGKRYRRMVGIADALIDFGGEQIPVQLHVEN